MTRHGTVSALNMGETAKDTSEFIEYINGVTNSFWGAQRLADGHPQSTWLFIVWSSNQCGWDSKYIR
jgi:alpha-L-arabinofuranosidase